MVLDQAVPGHAEWKLKFRSAVLKKERIDASHASKEDRCLLGKWLQGEGASRFGDNHLFRACKQKHAEFHREAGRVALAIDAGNFTEADALLSAASAYSKASSDVSVAIIMLKRELAVVLPPAPVGRAG
jgi:methyl-accepting chemotaxis protein